MKLNLGGRDSRIDGFINVDVHEGPNVDLKADISDLKSFDNGSVEEIYASHCLEHFPHTKTVDVLKEWHRILAKRGKAYISVPDMETVFEIAKREGLVPWCRNMIWGDQGYKEAFHYTGFTYPSLSKALIDAGFFDVHRIRKMPYNLADCSNNIVPQYADLPLSVSVEAVA